MFPSINWTCMLQDNDKKKWVSKNKKNFWYKKGFQIKDPDMIWTMIFAYTALHMERHIMTFRFIHHWGDHTQISSTAPQQFHFNHHDNTQITACWLKPLRLVHRSFWDASSFTTCPFSSEQELIFINFEEAYFVRTAWKFNKFIHNPCYLITNETIINSTMF